MLSLQLTPGVVHAGKLLKIEVCDHVPDALRVREPITEIADDFKADKCYSAEELKVLEAAEKRPLPKKLSDEVYERPDQPVERSGRAGCERT